jgi:hypothetical protein
LALVGVGDDLPNDDGDETPNTEAEFASLLKKEVKSTMRLRPPLQQGLRTFTEPSFGNTCIRGVRGSVCALAFTKRPSSRMALSFAVA